MLLKYVTECSPVEVVQGSLAKECKTSLCHRSCLSLQVLQVFYYYHTLPSYYSWVKHAVAIPLGEGTTVLDSVTVYRKESLFHSFWKLIVVVCGTAKVEQRGSP